MSKRRDEIKQRIARVVAEVEQIVEESGGPADFDASQWVARWVAEPLPP